MQGRGPVTGREVQTHQTPVGVLVQRGEDEPAVDRFNGGLKLSCFELQLGEAVVDLTRAQVPVFALEAHPVVEGRGVAQREALQELATGEAGRAFELGKQAAMRLFWHGQIDEEREFLACGEQQQLISMAHFWRTQQSQGEVAHLTFLITLCCYHEIRDDTDKRTDFIQRNTRRVERFKGTTTSHPSIIAHNTT